MGTVSSSILILWPELYFFLFIWIIRAQPVNQPSYNLSTKHQRLSAYTAFYKTCHANTRRVAKGQWGDSLGCSSCSVYHIDLHACCSAVCMIHHNTSHSSLSFGVQIAHIWAWLDIWVYTYKSVYTYMFTHERQRVSHIPEPTEWRQA